MKNKNKATEFLTSFKQLCKIEEDKTKGDKRNEN